MIYGSVCSGIEAASLAWKELGWKPAFFSEIERFPRAVLAHHYPAVPLHGDFTTIGENEYGSIDLLVGGTPCQSFSVAGLRKGMADERGNLALEFLRLAQRKRPKWLLWENVPGVLSANEGRDFGAFLGGLAECGYGFAYRVFDAQYFGLAQRRKRVFVVGYLGDWRPSRAVLLEPASLRGDPAPRRKTREDIAGTLGARSCRSVGAQDAYAGHLIAYAPEVASTLQTTCDDYSRADGFTMVVHGTQDPDIRFDLAHTLGRNRGQENAIFYENHMQDSRVREVDVCPTLSAKAGTGGGNLPLVQLGSIVRRLTPLECERLMGMPDNYTKIKANTPDAPRYESIGNSFPVPVLRWLGRRIQTVDDIMKNKT